METMARRHFTLAEAEALIPALERIFFLMLQLRIALRKQERRLEAAGLRISRELLDQDDPREPFEVRQAKALFAAYCEAISDKVAEIGALSGEVKDVEIGLVDFPSRRGAEEILFCWRLGEKRIGFWHSQDAGFAGRKPIDELVPAEPPVQE